jgi:glutathione S-transferase
MSDITVHHLDNSRSQRILWMLEELGLEYTLKEWKRNPETMRAPPELKDVHPLGKAPVVQIGETVFAESGAILETLVARYDTDGRFVPESQEGQEELRFWMHYAEGSLMPPLLVKLIVGRLKGDQVPFFVRPVAKGIADKIDGAYTDPEITKHFAFIEAHLASREWFAGGQFTAADVQMSFPLEAGGQRAGIPMGPSTRAFLDRIQKRPAYQRALKKGGGFTGLG